MIASMWPHYMTVMYHMTEIIIVIPSPNLNFPNILFIIR